MLSILFFLFIAIVSVQFIYYVVIFGRFSFSKSIENHKMVGIPISVIVCAKNEQENVAKYVPLLVEQNYPNFEIILIDDASRDDTLEIFEQFEKQYQKIKLVKVENNEAFWGNKKFALTLGIKAAKNQNLLFIDADCYPNSKNWIAEMSGYFSEEKSIVLGYGAYEKVEGSFLNKIIRYETLLTATQYFSWAKIGKPYMGVGRNMAYKVSEFYKSNGYINHMKVRSGDDDLFINEVADKANTTFCVTPNSFTYSVPKKNFSAWFSQKRRHISTASHYKFFDKMQLAIFFLSQVLFFVVGSILLAFLTEWQIVLGLIIVRYLFSWISLGYSAAQLQEKDVVYWFPVVEIALICTQINVFLSNLISKPVHWR